MPAVEYVVPPVPAHTVEKVLVIFGIGFGLMATEYTAVVTEHVVANDSVNCRLPGPVASHVTVMLRVPAPAVIVPLVIAQTYVFPLLGVE